jgi:6-phosphogluconate dehydrogenase
MQLIAEAWAQLRDRRGLSAAAAADCVAGWRAGGDSFLLAITERVLREADPATGRPLVDLIVDEAEQKGTGAWASIAAIELGVPAPTLLEAAQARSLSALRALRGRLAAPDHDRHRPSSAVDPGVLGEALRAATSLAYVQGFMVLGAAGPAFGWPLDLATVARIWQGGCIIRAELLQELERAATAAPAAATLLEDAALTAAIEADVAALRAFVADAARTGLAVPAHGSALAWLDGIRTARGPADLIQAQRDLFGAHRFARSDRPGTFHHSWGAVP